MKIVPIDIDFAGWCEVPEGKQNAWGIITDEQTLVVARPTREAAEAKMQALKDGDA